MAETLVPALELASHGPVRFPNESAEYRAARTTLLAEEIELRRRLERVAVALAIVARSPIERLLAWKERGWRNLRLFSDLDDNYSRDYHGVLPNGGEVPSFNVFTRRDGTIRHFWGWEITNDATDPGQDPRGAPDPAPLWSVLDSTPEGRGTDWYPSLEYAD
jgi:predicted dithiol-disulfide oxidoreductase (DUF899 family)